jgi:hypothetical protein
MENLVLEYAAFPVAGFCIAGPHIEVMTLFSTELSLILVLKIVRPTCIYTCKEQLCERFAAGIKFTNKQTTHHDFFPFSTCICLVKKAAL